MCSLTRVRMHISLYDYQSLATRTDTILKTSDKPPLPTKVRDKVMWDPHTNSIKCGQSIHFSIKQWHQQRLCVSAPTEEGREEKDPKKDFQGKQTTFRTEAVSLLQVQDEVTALAQASRRVETHSVLGSVQWAPELSVHSTTSGLSLCTEPLQTVSNTSTGEYRTCCRAMEHVQKHPSQRGSSIDQLTDAITCSQFLFPPIGISTRYLLH